MMNIENSYEPHAFPCKLPVLKLPELSGTYVHWGLVLCKAHSDQVGLGEEPEALHF